MAEEYAAALAHGSPPAGGEGLSADAFRGLVTAFKDAQMQRAADVEAGAVVQRREQIKALIDQHIDDTKWRESLHQARQVAERGEKEYLLLRFPSELCTDNARAINNPPNPDWPKTLQGEAMELYARWRDQLSPSWIPPCGARARFSRWQAGRRGFVPVLGRVALGGFLPRRWRDNR